MHILTTEDTDEQRLYFTPESSISGTGYYTLRAKDTNTSTDSDGTVSTDGYHQVLTDVFYLDEGRHYFIEIFSDSGGCDSLAGSGRSTS